MGSETGSVILTTSQAACLEALGNGGGSKTNIAITAGLDLVKTLQALKRLEGLGFIEQDEKNRWRICRRGEIPAYEIIPDRIRRKSRKPGPGARRLLEMLDRPRRASELAGRLGLTRQRVHQLVVKLHATGAIRIGDHGSRFYIIARGDDPTELISRSEERVLSAVPDEFATGAANIRSAARLSMERTKDSLARFLSLGLIEEVTGPEDEILYRLTAAGLAHPQYDGSARRADRPRLPVQSDRVFAVLSSISDNGQIRIKRVSQLLGIPHTSVNALFQYLKRKNLVQKTDGEKDSPYTLSDEGRRVLSEMVRQRTS